MQGLVRGAGRPERSWNDAPSDGTLFVQSPKELHVITHDTTIRGFHAHIYFDAKTRRAAEELRDALARRFDVEPGVMHDEPVGPHTKPMFEVDLAPEQFATIVPWLMVHRHGLSVLVHPTTEDPVADHETRPLWMGEPLPLDVALVRRLLEAAQTGRKMQYVPVRTVASR